MTNAPRHVLWKGRGKVHAIRPPRMSYETEHAGQTWCGLYGSFAKTFVTSDSPLTCKTCLREVKLTALSVLWSRVSSGRD